MSSLILRCRSYSLALEGNRIFVDVQIYSSRTGQAGGIGAMREWLLNFAIHEFSDKDVVDRFMHTISFPEQKPTAFSLRSTIVLFVSMAIGLRFIRSSC